MGRELDRAQDGAEPLKPQNRIHNNVTNHIVHVSIKKKRKKEGKKKKQDEEEGERVRACARMLDITLHATEHRPRTHARTYRRGGWLEMEEMGFTCSPALVGYFTSIRESTASSPWGSDFSAPSAWRNRTASSAM